METTDAFTAGVEINEGDDPFAGTDFGDFSDPEPEPAAPAEPVPSVDAEIPIVNAEGERISPEAAEAARKAQALVDAEKAEQAAAMAAHPVEVTPEMAAMERGAVQAEGDAVAAEERGDAGEARQQERVAEDELRDEVVQAADFAPAAAQAPAREPVDPTPASVQAAEPGTGDPPTANGADSEVAERFNPVTAKMEPPPEDKHAETQARLKAVAEREAAEAAVEIEAPIPDVETAPPPAEPPAEPPAPATAPVVAKLEAPEDPHTAAEPAEEKDKKGRTVKRRYVILQVDGPGRFSQIAWHVDKAGKMTTKGPGTRRQTVALARSTDDALKIGYAAVGSPSNGVTLIACASLHFQPKKIEPMTPEPEKQRLRIT